MKYTIYIIFLLLLSNCTGYQYVSSPQYVPFNEKKGELKTNISYTALQLGYSITNNLSIFYDYDFRVRNYSSSMITSEHDGTISGSHKANDNNIGFSFFKSRNQFIYEVLVAGGFGDMSYSNNVDSFAYNNFSLKVNKKNFYIQPTIGYKMSEGNSNGVIGLFTRIYCTRYTNIKTEVFKSNYVSVNPDNAYFIGKNKIDLFFIEPGLLLRVGKKHISFQTIISPTISLNSNHLKYRSFNLFFGLFLNFDCI